MIKLSRKKSSDPLQEHLRETKSLWNKDVSSFITNLINVKKTMNGSPSKFHPEKGTIKEPILGDPQTLLNGLANDFSEIIQHGNKIISEQLEYSKNRKKPTVKSPSNLSDAVQKVLTSSIEYQLLAEGSNPLTRFWTRLKNPMIGFSEQADLRRTQISMLNSCADSFYDLDKFQVLVVKSSKESITEAHKKLESAAHNWNLVYRIFNKFKSTSSTNRENIVNTQPSVNTELINSPEDNSLKNDLINPEINIKQMVLDYKNNIKFLPEIFISNELDVAVDKFISSRGKKVDLDLDKLYYQAIAQVNEQLKTDFHSFQEIGDFFKKSSSMEENMIEKKAQDFLKKWLGKTKHQLNFLNPGTSNFRLNCFKEAENIKSDLNKIMNILEDSINVEELEPLMKSVNSNFASLKGLMSSLYLSSRPNK
jgi:hypothetical protein